MVPTVYSARSSFTRQHVVMMTDDGLMSLISVPGKNIELLANQIASLRRGPDCREGTADMAWPPRPKINQAASVQLFNEGHGWWR